MITESKYLSTLSTFKDGENSILSMIAKRIEKWDANSGKHSREPMFLCDWNRTSMSWSTISNLQIELSDDNEETDSVKETNKNQFDGFLQEYIRGEKTPNDQYILGVFIDRCFIPIMNKETFDQIWNKIINI